MYVTSTLVNSIIPLQYRIFYKALIIPVLVFPISSQEIGTSKLDSIGRTCLSFNHVNCVSRPQNFSTAISSRFSFSPPFFYITVDVEMLSRLPIDPQNFSKYDIILSPTNICFHPKSTSVSPRTNITGGV